MKLNGVRSFVESLLSGSRYGRGRGAKRRRGERVGRSGEVCEQRMLLTVDLTLLQDNNSAAVDRVNYLAIGDTAGRTYFTSQDGVHGLELWSSDGTVNGTHMVKDIAPGMASSRPVALGIINNQAIFWANDGVHGAQLWKTDGTANGTVMITNVAGFDFSDGAEYVISGNKLYTDAYDPVHGWEMWVSDGTAAGTFMAGDVCSGNSVIHQVTDVNGTVFYTEQPDDEGAYQLWKVDPATGQSVLMKDISPDNMANVNGTLYFGVDHQLWKSDGTPAGTVLVKDFNTTIGSGVNLLGEIGSSAVFLVNDGVHGQELWISDGTEAGTQLIKDSVPGSDGFSRPGLHVAANGKIYISLDDGVHGTELWVTNGTANGTAMLADITPGAGDTPLDMTVTTGGTVYFRAGANLWKTNGNISGTTLVKDFSALGLAIVPRLGAGYDMKSLITVGNKVAFQVYDAAQVAHYWVSDGTEAGTFALQDESDASSQGPSSVLRTFPVSTNGRLFFVGLNATAGWDLWSSDLTVAGTHNLGQVDVRTGDLASGGDAFRWSSTVVGETLYYTSGRDLWKSDGTTTVLEKTFPGVSEAILNDSSFGGAADVGGMLFFTVDDGVHGLELWKSDGTTAGTTMIKDINPGVSGSSIGRFQAVGGTLYFTANDSVHGVELWKSDGTAGGTVLVKDLVSGSIGSSDFAPLGVDDNGKYYFQLHRTVNEVWVTDGSSGGTRQLAGIQLENFASSPATLLNGAFYFSVRDSAHGSELWKLDIASETASLVLDVNPGTASGFWGTTSWVVNGKLMFVADDGVNGRALWTSDGTPAGTVLVKGYGQDLGISGSTPVVSGGLLYFTADDGVHGVELWRSDGTTAGTSLVKDVNADDLNSTGPRTLVDVNGTLYFFNSNDISTRTYDLWKTDGTDAGTVRVLSSNSFVGPLIGTNRSPQAVNVDGMVFLKFDDSIHGTEWWSTRLVAESAGSFRNGTFYLDADNSGGWNSGGSVQSFTGGSVSDKQFSFGIAGDIPVTGDWNGDEAQEVGVFRNGIWYLDRNGNYKWNGVAGGDVTFSFGTAGDTPITGDWNGDGITDVGVVRNGAWYLDMNGNHKWDSGTDAYFKFGNPGDKPVTGDWNGDGTTEIGVFRGATWYLDMDGNRKWNAGDVSFNFGTAGDIPVTGDWNGDLKTDVGVFRNGFYYVDKDANRKWSAGDVKFGFGNASDVPLSGTWNLKIPAASPPAAAPAALVAQAPEQTPAVSTLAVETSGSVSKPQVKGHAKKQAHKGKS